MPTHLCPGVGRKHQLHPKHNTKNFTPIIQTSITSHPINTTYYTFPHSPTAFCFPPSSCFQEWRGRCFRCCRKGHTVATYRNPIKCGKCWKDGHPGTCCLQPKQPTLNPAAQSFLPANKIVKGSEPMFDKLLTGPYPYALPTILGNRPEQVTCYVERDEDYKEVDNLGAAVVMTTDGFEADMHIDQIADLASQTGLVHKEEIMVNVIPGGKYLMVLPSGLAPATFINVIPPSVWKLGVGFQTWST